MSIKTIFIVDDDFLRHARHFAFSHHEKWDGTGYPQGLRGVDAFLTVSDDFLAGSTAGTGR